MRLDPRTPGVYRAPVVVRTADIHLRGLDRNRVVLDGGHRPGNGIDVVADGVWIENVTVRNFDRRALNDEEAGNEIRWRGVRGWHGNYLTVYDTGLLGGYGLYAAGSVGGEWYHVYASGLNDSGRSLTTRRFEGGTELTSLRAGPRTSGCFRV